MLEWSGVEEFKLGAACLNSRSPVHGGHGAGAGQRPHRLAVGLARGRLRCGVAKGQERERGRRGASLAGGDGLAGSVRARAARARACGVGGGQFPCPGGAVLCWERQGAALGLGGRLRCRLCVGDRDGMATGAVLPGMVMIGDQIRRNGLLPRGSGA